MKKELIIISITFIIANLIRGFFISYTGFSFNLWQDSFDLIAFLIDFAIWALSYVGVRLTVTNFTKKKVSKN